MIYLWLEAIYRIIVDLQCASLNVRSSLHVFEKYFIFLLVIFTTVKYSLILIYHEQLSKYICFIVLPGCITVVDVQNANVYSRNSAVVHVK